ncbi:MAG: hypothetical protein V1835_06780 [Candidatus Micrarchaeota archaeon]
MDLGFSTNNILDGIIVGLALIVIYLLINRDDKSGFHTREHKKEMLKKEKELSDIRSSARRQLNSLMDERGRTQHLISDAKKRYMKGDITYEAMKLIVEEYDRRLVEIDGKLEEFDLVYG